jgi:gamma-glutamylcyclotransferase
VLAYVATKTQAQIQPYSWYRALVVAGAVEHGLPSAYVDGLRGTPVRQDPDDKRHSLNMALAGDA